MTITKRVLRRHLRGAVFKNLSTRIARRYLQAVTPSAEKPEPASLFDAAAAVTADDIIGALYFGRGILVNNVNIYSAPDIDGPNVVRWTATDANGELVRGIVTVTVDHDVHEVSARMVVDVVQPETLAARVASGYRRGAIFERLTAPVIIMSDGGVITVRDLERLLAVDGVHVADVQLSRSDRLALNTFVWSGVDHDGHPVRGQLKIHLAFSAHSVVVSGEVTVLNMDIAPRIKEADDKGDHDYSTAPPLPVKQRLQLISSIARLAIAALRERPNEVPVVVSHLSDIVELAEAGWAADP